MISKPTDSEPNPDEARRRADAIYRQLPAMVHRLARAGIDLVARLYPGR
jgi:hypothetical protein